MRTIQNIEAISIFNQSIESSNKELKIQARSVIRREVYPREAKKVLKLGGSISHRSWRTEDTASLNEEGCLINQNGVLFEDTMEEFFHTYTKDARFFAFNEHIIVIKVN